MSEITTSWHSYPKVFQMGHRAVAELLLDDVLVEEKIDGSQFSFGVFDGELKVRSHGQVMITDAPEQMFKKAVDVVKTFELTPGWTYRAEYLSKPKHNSLCYDRVPNNHLIIFDINAGEEAYLSYSDKTKEAERLGLETVPIMFEGTVNSPQDVLSYLEKESVLGGQKIEGVVIKNYNRFGLDKKVLMGKYVSERFKEVHGREWKKGNPVIGDIIQRLIFKYKTPARWEKAVIHLKEAGEIEGSPRDIGKLIYAVWPDIVEECKEEIMDELWRFAEPKLKRAVTGGLPEWYKQRLLEKQFNGGN